MPIGDMLSYEDFIEKVANENLSWTFDDDGEIRLLGAMFTCPYLAIDESTVDPENIWKAADNRAETTVQAWLRTLMLEKFGLKEREI